MRPWETSGSKTLKSLEKIRCTGYIRSPDRKFRCGMLFFFSLLFKISCEIPVSKECKKYVSTLIMLSLVTKITGVEDALSGAPLWWLICQSYKRESLVATHGRRARSTLESESLPVCGALEKWWWILDRIGRVVAEQPDSRPNRWEKSR